MTKQIYRSREEVLGSDNELSGIQPIVVTGVYIKELYL